MAISASDGALECFFGCKFVHDTRFTAHVVTGGIGKSAGGHNPTLQTGQKVIEKLTLLHCVQVLHQKVNSNHQQSQNSGRFIQFYELKWIYGNSKSSKTSRKKLTECCFQARKTSRERPKSAPYLRLKNSKRTSNCQSISELGTLL